MTAQEVNEWRVFPRLFIGLMFALWFAIANYMLFSIPMADQHEWVFVQFAAISLPFMGSINKYFDT
ncbi:MAG: hypothetical protein R8M45_07250 [Ghiorsea sp.]